MTEYNVYASAQARLVKTVEAKTSEAAIRKAKANIDGWFIANNDGISLEHMANHYAEEAKS